MIIGVDGDGTIWDQEHREYGDFVSPLVVLPGAVDGLQALKRAGHLLALFSGRFAPCNLHNPMLRPRVMAGLEQVDWERWPQDQVLNQARANQMVVAATALGVFAYCTSDKGGLDLIIDNQALRFGRGVLGAGWRQIARMYGEPDQGRKFG